MIVEVEDSGYATSPLLSGTVCLSLPSCRGPIFKTSLWSGYWMKWGNRRSCNPAIDYLPEQILSGNLNPNERFLVDYSISGLGIRSINIRIYILHRWRLWEYDTLCRHRLVSVDERHGQPSQYLIFVAFSVCTCWTSLNVNTLEVGNQDIYYSKYILLAATSFAQSTSRIDLFPQTIYCTRTVTIWNASLLRRQMLNHNRRQF